MDTPSATPPPTPSKPWIQSKTIWLQVISLLCLFIPAVGQWVKNNPVEPLVLLGALNVLVRCVTSDRVRIFRDEDDSLSGSGSARRPGTSGMKGGSQVVRDRTANEQQTVQRALVFPWLVGAARVACMLLAVLMLPGCEGMKDLPVSVAIEGTHGSYSYDSETGIGIAVKTPKVKATKSAGAECQVIGDQCRTAALRMEEVLYFDPRRPYLPRRLCVADEVSLGVGPMQCRRSPSMGNPLLSAVMSGNGPDSNERRTPVSGGAGSPVMIPRPGPAGRGPFPMPAVELTMPLATGR